MTITNIIGLDETQANAEIVAEYIRATSKFGAFASTHEGYAVILEELDEAWSEIKANATGRAIEEMIQVGAMALRFVVDMRRQLADKENN